MIRHFKSKICIRCGKEFIPNGNQQKYCTDCKINYTKWHFKDNYIPHPLKLKICLICGKQIKSMGRNQKYCKECKPIAEKEWRKQWQQGYGKQWSLTHSEYYKQYMRQWTKNNPEKIKKTWIKHFNKRNCSLDFVPLNRFFEGAIAHHIDKTYVIYIPEEVHQSISHSVLRNKNMDAINAIAFNYL